MSRPHEHADAAGAPGASGPGDPGYDGSVTIGDEGATTDDEGAVRAVPPAEEPDQPREAGR